MRLTTDSESPAPKAPDIPHICLKLSGRVVRKSEAATSAQLARRRVSDGPQVTDRHTPPGRLLAGESAQQEALEKYLLDKPTECVADAAPYRNHRHGDGDEDRDRNCGMSLLEQ